MGSGKCERSRFDMNVNRFAEGWSVVPTGR